MKNELTEEVKDTICRIYVRYRLPIKKLASAFHIGEESVRKIFKERRVAVRGKGHGVSW